MRFSTHTFFGYVQVNPTTIAIRHMFTTNSADTKYESRSSDGVFTSHSRRLFLLLSTNSPEDFYLGLHRRISQDKGRGCCYCNGCMRYTDIRGNTL